MSAFFLLENKYECKDLNVPLDEIRPEMRVRSAQRNCRVCTHIWTLLLLGLHSYLDLNVITIEVRYGLFQNQNCSFIWIPLKLTVQSNLEPNMTDIAIISGTTYILGKLSAFAFTQSDRT